MSKMLMSMETNVRMAISAIFSTKNTGLLMRKNLAKAINENMNKQITRIVTPIVCLIVSTCLTLRSDKVILSKMILYYKRIIL